MRRITVLGGCAALALLVPGSAAVAADAPVTPAGWAVTPAGQEIGVSKAATGFQGPLGTALSPDGGLALTASSGASQFESSDLFDLAAGQRSDSVPYDAKLGQSVFYGTVFSPDGRRAWTSGGGQNVVHSYTVADGKLTAGADLNGTGMRFPAGLAYGSTPKGDRIYVANNLDPAPVMPGASNPPGHTVSVIDPNANGGAGAVTGLIDLGAPLEPIGVTFDRSGRKAYVTNWIGRSVSVIDTETEKKVADILLSPRNAPLGADHPSAITANPKRDEIYTANANSDTVSVINSATDTLVRTIDVSVAPGAQKGATPDGLSVSPDGQTLFVAEAGENAVAVVALDGGRGRGLDANGNAKDGQDGQDDAPASEPAADPSAPTREGVQGFIPTGWYPADVDVTPDGRRLVVTNTNDSGAGPNPCGKLQPPTPPAECTGTNAPPPETQYAGTMIKGSLQVLDIPDNHGRLQSQTERVLRNNQIKGRVAKAPKSAAAIKHVIYVIKENRTYDQMFGDLPGGNGDPRLALFKDDSAPNHRELARRFGLIDNFYADADISADGHNWSTQAGATDYVDKTWPITYSPSPRSRQRGYDFEDNPPIAQYLSEPLASDPTVPRPAAAQTVGYLWDNAFAHGVSYKSYGEYTAFSSACTGPITSNTTHLDSTRFPGHIDPKYVGYTMSCSDHAQREPEWEREFDGYVKDGNLPGLEIVRLPNDHTQGTRAGKATPQAYVADNDLALGRLVDKVSHSPYWKSTMILVTEDDAQNGPDHVDAHRTVALAISPYTQRRGKVDSTHYDTSSMIATTEDLLGLPPMTITDARVNRMWGSFTQHPDATPYVAKTPTITPFGAATGVPINAAAAPMARAAARWNLSREDRAPEIALNQSIWKSIKGRHAKMPAPRHVHIIGTRANDEEDAR